VVPALVVPKAEHRAEIFDAFEVVRWKIAIERTQSILERLKPSLDIIALATAHHNVLQPKSSCRPIVPWATVGDDNWLPITIVEATFQESQSVNCLAVLGHEQIDDLPIFGVYGRKNEDPAPFCTNLCLVDDETAPPLASEELLSQISSKILYPLPDSNVGYLHTQVVQELLEPTEARTLRVEVRGEDFRLRRHTIAHEKTFCLLPQFIAGGQVGEELDEFRQHEDHLLCLPHRPQIQPRIL